MSSTMLSKKERKHASSIIDSQRHCSRDRAAMRSCSRVEFRIERDPLGEVRVPADALLRRADAARGRELPHQRPDRAARARHRHGAHQEGGRAGERRRSAGSTPAIADAIVAAADEILAGQLPRPVRRRRLPGRRRHLAQHEHQRGARQPRGEMLGGRRGALHARASERSRQHGAVDQRRLPDRDAARAARDAAGPARRRPTALADGLRAKSARVRARAEDRPHAPAGRRADHARPGVRRLRRQRRARGGGASSAPPSSCSS